MQKLIDFFVRNRRDIIDYLAGNKDVIDNWNLLVTQEFSLLRLKEYIENGNTFWSFEARYNDKDIIIYQVSDRKLNIWLQEDYNFVSNFLCKIEFEGFSDVYEILNDRYFGYEFTNIFDEIQYDERMKSSN